MPADSGLYGLQFAECDYVRTAQRLRRWNYIMSGWQQLRETIGQNEIVKLKLDRVLFRNI